jgi:hypothetical protein
MHQLSGHDLALVVDAVSEVSRAPDRSAFMRRAVEHTVIVVPCLMARWPQATRKTPLQGWKYAVRRA